MTRTQLLHAFTALLLSTTLGTAQLAPVNTGTAANDGSGDTLRTAFQKINSNFTAVASGLAGLTNAVAASQTPWHTDVDAGLFSLTHLGQLAFDGGSFFDEDGLHIHGGQVISINADTTLLDSAGNITFAGVATGNGSGLTHLPPANGTVYPAQFGAVADGVVDVSRGPGMIQAVGGTDDGPVFNTLFNAATNGTTIDGQNKIYFVNTPMFLTNSGGGPIRLRRLRFASTNRNLVTLTTGISQIDAQGIEFIGTTNCVSSCALSNDWNYVGVLSDYSVANTWADVRFKGGFFKDAVVRHQTNPKFTRCIFANAASNGVHIVSSDQVMLEGCVFGYSFDPFQGTSTPLTNELTGGGNWAWTNNVAVRIDAGNGTTLLNCEHYAGGSLLYCRDATFVRISGDFEQFYCPPSVPICWATNTTVICDYPIFINNAPGVSNVVTTWKLDNCNLTGSRLNGGLVTSSQPMVDIYGNPSGGNGFPSMQWYRSDCIVRLHAGSYGVAGSAGTDFPMPFGTTPSTADANTWIGQQTFTNIVWVEVGKVNQFGFGSDLGTNGTVTASRAHGGSLSGASFGSATLDAPLFGYFAAGLNATHTTVGGDGVTSGSGGDDIWFETAYTGTRGSLVGVWDGVGLYPFGRITNGTTAHPWAAVCSTNLIIAGTTNQLIFGGTNTAPASSTAVKWVSVQVSGESTVYRLPLMQ